MFGWLNKILDGNDKEIRRYSRTVEQINALEPEMQALSDDELASRTPAFKERLARGESLDDLLPEAFAVVREAARRVAGMRHFDVQLIGGMVLHEGRIAEMKTGEGKTLVATLPLYLNALTGRGVHLVTVNDYLAKLHAEWMGRIYRFLGLSVGVIVHGLSYEERRAAYAADITYGTNNEIGFDYLRDNMVVHPQQLVQRELHYAIIDEVDSILIDEARTPLIISGQADTATDHYYRFAQLVPRLKPEEDYTVDEKARTVAITEEGAEKLEKWLGVENLYDEAHFELTHYLNQALKAHALFRRDRDYVVKDGQVVIVDEFTGRLMEGRRYSDGLHQAIEAKEGVKIERESQTLASITYQNLFRLYEKLAGMTGTAKTEEPEFMKIYGMDVVVVPTNKPMIRADHPDVVYKTQEGKFKAIVEEIVELHKTGRPVLVGTVSIETSERLSKMLRRVGVPHQVLNAKYHEKEAEIIAQAGRIGAVTIATNMAGRGTDIMLGGNPDYLARVKLRSENVDPELISRALGTAEGGGEEAEAVRKRFAELREEFSKETEAEKEKVVALGGLHVLGTERHESRRIDNQLRGRSGRQGDPGSSRFYVSLEDDLMRLFGSERISAIMERLGWTDDQPIEHNQITRALENAQKKVEAHHFEIRKQVLQYDDVLNRQRDVVYSARRKVLLGEGIPERLEEMVGETVDSLMEAYCGQKTHPDDWDVPGLLERYKELAAAESPLTPEEADGLDREQIAERLGAGIRSVLEQRRSELGEETFHEMARMVLLHFIDSKWMEHLRSMDELRSGIGLRAYGQRDPLLEYKFEAFKMFQEMLDSVREDTLRYLVRVQPAQAGDQARRQAEDRLRRAVMNRTSDGAVQQQGRPATRRVANKVGRNEPCPCGSGKKYKRCCGAA